MRDVSSIAEALADRCEETSTALLGQPSSARGGEMRWGRHGSLSLCRRGPKRGQWFDHEAGEGGDMLHLLAREHGTSIGDAMQIARRDYLGDDITPRPRPKPTVPTP